MKKSFILLGALTSKPYAFTARSWELKSIETIDLFDSLGSNLRIDIRGSSIMRVLPQNNDYINEEWISDKARYSYDGLKRERFINPMVKKKNIFIQTSWKDVFQHISAKLFKIDNFIINTGNFNDLEHFVSLQKFNNNFIKNVKISINSNKKINADLQEYYTLNNSLLNLNSSKIYLLIGVNLRLENPILNIRFRKLSLNNSALIAFIGCYSDYNLNLIHLGNNVKVLERILKGKHFFCTIMLNFLKKNSRNVKIQNQLKNKIEVLFGNEMLNLNKHIEIIEVFKQINFLPVKFSFNSLEMFAGKINMKELGFFNTQKTNLDSKKMFYLLNTESIKDLKKNDFVIFQGHHNKKSRLKFDVILPTTTWIEKSSLYLNCFGVMQKSQLVITPPNGARDDWKITTFFSFFLTNESKKVDLNNTNSNTFIELIHRDIEKMFPNFLKNSNQNVYFPLNISKNIHTNKKIKSNIFPFKALISNYYRITSVDKASKIMMKCTETFLKKKTNFLNKN